jgi:peptide/nickel transport system substrate-binding protein
MTRFAIAVLLVVSLAGTTWAQPKAAPAAKPEGEMRWALYVTLAPAWFDPGELTAGFITPFWVLYALHDALFKAMPGNQMAPSLAESWKESPDGKTYEFKLREGLKFHNGDPFTAEDVKFSYQRAKGYKIMRDKVRDLEVAGPLRVLHQIQKTLAERVRFGMIYDYVWPSGVGPKVAEPASPLPDGERAG